MKITIKSAGRTSIKSVPCGNLFQDSDGRIYLKTDVRSAVRLVRRPGDSYGPGTIFSDDDCGLKEGLDLGPAQVEVSE